MEYLAIKNWDKYQSTKVSKWVKDYVNKDFDQDFMSLSLAQKAMLDACCRLRARHGCNMPNDALWICRAVAVRPQDRHNAVTAVRQLIDSGFLILTNESDSYAEKPRLDKIRVDKEEKEPSARSARGRNSQAAKASGETRHTRVKQLVHGFYRDWGGEECPWDGSEAKQLDSLLKATPNWDDCLFVTCLTNLAKSDCVAKGARPREWLGHLPKFLKGPLDQYKNPKAVANGQTRSASKADAREQRIFERAAKFARNRVDSAGEPLGQSSSPLALPGDGGHGISGLAGDARATAVGVGSSGPRQVDALPAKT